MNGFEPYWLREFFKWGDRIIFFAALWVIGLFVEHTVRFVWCAVRGGLDDKR